MPTIDFGPVMAHDDGECHWTCSACGHTIGDSMVLMYPGILMRHLRQHLDPKENHGR